MKLNKINSELEFYNIETSTNLPTVSPGTTRCVDGYSTLTFAQANSHVRATICHQFIGAEGIGRERVKLKVEMGYGREKEENDG